MNTVLPPQTDPDAAIAWINAWFGEDFSTEYMTLALLRNMGGQGGRAVPRYIHLPPQDAVSTIKDNGLDGLVYAMEKNWNVFMSVGVAKKPPEDKNGNPSPYKKGGRHNVSRVPGVWVDLDVDKPGSFDDEAECLALLRELPRAVQPSIVVATGTGGVHGYWKTERPLSMQEAEGLCTRWWVYLTSRTHRPIDKLTNADRIMKLPGTIRWPKTTGDNAELVRLLAAAPDWKIPLDLMMEITEPSYQAFLQDIEDRKEEIKRSRERAATTITGGVTNGRWGRLMTLATIEDEFNELYTWDDILPALGWTKLEQDSEGRDQWARPGLEEYELHKSAATDYDGSHVMSLFSDSVDTGLARLKDTGIALTKYRVFVECVWHGDEAGFVEEWMKRT